MNTQEKAQISVNAFQYLRDGTIDYSTAGNMSSELGAYLTRLYQAISQVQTQSTIAGTKEQEITEPGRYSLITILTRDKTALTPDHFKELKDTEKWTGYVWTKAQNQPRLLRKRQTAELLEDKVNSHGARARRNAKGAVQSQTLNLIYQNDPSANAFARTYGIIIPQKTPEELMTEATIKQSNDFKKAYRCNPDPTLLQIKQRKLFRKPRLVEQNGIMKLEQGLGLSRAQLEEVCRLAQQYKTQRNTQTAIQAAARAAVFGYLFNTLAANVPKVDTLIPILGLPANATDDEIIAAASIPQHNNGNNGGNILLLGSKLADKVDKFNL